MPIGLHLFVRKDYIYLVVYSKQCMLTLGSKIGYRHTASI